MKYQNFGQKPNFLSKKQKFGQKPKFFVKKQKFGQKRQKATEIETKFLHFFLLLVKRKIIMKFGRFIILKY